MKINLGCGSKTPEGWINVDYALGARVMRISLLKFVSRRLGLFGMDWSDDIYIHDLRKIFPWKSDSVDVVYSSHTLEHLSKSEGRKFLKECYRVLKKHGTIRIVVPNLSSLISEYIEGSLRADDFVEKLGVLYETERDGFLRKRFSPFIQFPHKCMYDPNTLLEIFNEIGFRGREKQPFESDIDDIKGVELKDRTRNAVIIEGKK
jgi:SAM-dependent methyltransferase